MIGPGALITNRVRVRFWRAFKSAHAFRWVDHPDALACVRRAYARPFLWISFSFMACVVQTSSSRFLRMEEAAVGRKPAQLLRKPSSIGANNGLAAHSVRMVCNQGIFRAF